MRAILLIIGVSLGFMEGVCHQWCRDFPGGLYEAGEWQVRENRCRCFVDYEKDEMDGIIHIPLSAPKKKYESKSL